MEEAGTATVHDAETLEKQLRFIRHYLRQSFAADERVAGLTTPQMNIMAILAKEYQKQQGGLTIRGLCREAGLSQSTVSGIVERLARKALVQREVDPGDKRRTLVRITGSVKEYLESDLRDRRLQPLLAVLRAASARERTLILGGVAALHRLLQTHAPHEGAPPSPDPDDPAGA